MSPTHEWYLLSSRGVILFHIAVNPGCTIAQIAEMTSLTQRSVWSIVNDLKRASMITTKIVRRRSHFAVNMGASFLHPTLPEVPLKVILGKLVSLRDRISRQDRSPRAHACPWPGCGGSLISGDERDTCLLCGRDPVAAQPAMRVRSNGRVAREPRPGGWKSERSPPRASR